MDLKFKFAPQDIIAQGRTTQKNIGTIRTWVSHLDDQNVPSKLQDEILILFLIACNNDLEITKKIIISHYKFKKYGPELFDDRSMKRADLQMALNTIHASRIPVRTDENYVIHYFNIHDTNYKNFELVPIMKMNFMLADISLQENPPDGLIVLIDMKGFGLMHMTKINFGAVKKFFQYVQEGGLLKMKAIHVINSVYFVDKIMVILKLFMKHELINMLNFYPPGMTQEEFFQVIPKRFLPMEYGGDLPSEKDLHEVTLQQFKGLQEFWELEEKMRKQSKYL